MPTLEQIKSISDVNEDDRFYHNLKVLFYQHCTAGLFLVFDLGLSID